MATKKDKEQEKRTELDPRQCVAARGLLNLTQQQLAELSAVTVKTVIRFESGSQRTSALVVRALKRALEDAGVLFLEENGMGPGVALKKTTPARSP